MQSNTASFTPDLFALNFKRTFALHHLDSLLSRPNLRLSAEEREFVNRMAAMRDRIEEISVDEYNTLKEVFDNHHPRAKHGKGLLGMAAMERPFRRKYRATDND
jgi:hypothetical protein